MHAATASPATARATNTRSSGRSRSGRSMNEWPARALATAAPLLMANTLLMTSAAHYNASNIIHYNASSGGGGGAVDSETLINRMAITLAPPPPPPEFTFSGLSMGNLSQATSTTTTTPTTITSAAPDASTAEAGDATDLITNEFVQIFFCIIYTTVFVLGVFGNVLVCYVVIRNRAMQTVTNIFITNLALSDILLCVLAVPFTPLYTFMGRWAFGRALCHLVSFAQGCSIYISTLTLTSIAIDRYFVIIYPFHPRMNLSTCIGIIVSIWIVALLATVPYGMYMRVVLYNNDTLAPASTPAAWLNASAEAEDDGVAYDALGASGSERSFAEAYQQVMMLASSSSSSSSVTTATPDEEEEGEGSAAYTPGTSYCEENWPSEHYQKVFGSVTTILQFVLPFIVISICYIWISIKLNARARAKPGTKSSRREEADRDRKKRTNRMLIAMVGVFGLSWLPLNVVNVINDFYVKSNEWRFYTLLFFVAHSIAMSSTCYNPFLYAWLNENFRKEFKHVLPCFNPSNNHLLSITRGYNRSERNTCGPRLYHAKRDGRDDDDEGHDGGRNGSLDVEDNGATQETSVLTGGGGGGGGGGGRDKLLIIPREATYGKPGGSPAGSFNAKSKSSDDTDTGIALSDNERLYQCRRQMLSNDIDSGDEEQTVEVKFCETNFNGGDDDTLEPISNNSKQSHQRQHHECINFNDEVDVEKQQ